MRLISIAGFALALIVVTGFGSHHVQTKADNRVDSVRKALDRRNKRFIDDYKRFSDSLVVDAQQRNKLIKAHIQAQLPAK